MLLAKGTHQSASFRNFDCSFYKPQVSFPLNFALPFSVMTHNSSEIFQLKHFMHWTKKVHQSTIFQNFKCFKEISPNSSCHFRNHKVREFKFCIAVQYHERHPLYFLTQTLYTLDKKTEIFRLEWLAENSPNSSCHI